MQLIVPNLWLVKGFAFFIRLLKVNLDVIRKEVPILVGISILLILILIDGEAGFVDGIIFITGIIIYVVVSIYFAKKEVSVEVEKSFKKDLHPHLYYLSEIS